MQFPRSNLPTALGPPLGSEIAANVANLACAVGVAFRCLRRVYIVRNSSFRIESWSRFIIIQWLWASTTLCRPQQPIEEVVGRLAVCWLSKPALRELEHLDHPLSLSSQIFCHSVVSRTQGKCDFMINPNFSVASPEGGSLKFYLAS